LKQLHQRPEKLTISLLGRTDVPSQDIQIDWKAYTSVEDYEEVLGRCPEGPIADKTRIALQLLKDQIQKDKISPEIIITEPSDNKRFSEKEVTVKGKVTDESGIKEVLVNGVETTVSPDGWFYVTIRLKFGENTIRIQAQDIYQNTSTRTVTVYIVDNTPPEIIITEPSDNKRFSEKEVTVKGKVTDESGIKEVLVNGVETTVSPDGWFYVTIRLKFGENTIRIQAQDIYQNTSTRTVTVYIVDNTPPEIIITEPSDNELLKGRQVTVKGKVTDESGIREVLVNGIEAKVLFGYFQVTIPLKMGRNTIQIQAQDIYNNTATIESIQVFRLL